MSIPMNTVCYECFLSKRLKQLRSLGDDAQASKTAKQMLQMLAQAPEDADSALMGGLCDALIKEAFGISADLMAQEKADSNAFVLSRIDDIRARIVAQADPVFAALQFATLGNYLDFAALQGRVSFQELDTMLENAVNMELDKRCYERLCKDLAEKRSLLYITDNAGEIVFDRLLAEQLHARYPHLRITFLVRGKPVANDALRADAVAAGITDPIIDSGSGIGGTSISRLSPEAKKALDEADILLAKGMGNTESMYGCGYNVYYAFLVKCQHFADFFREPLMKPLFIHDSTRNNK